ncbi:MAG: redox-regulated ATPase YchF [Candidatus Aenigmarchaeota archaeon]|nr:redox-regulated ATPase YchF [Candidatus Aenigmarchaeota archaeon]
MLIGIVGKPSCGKSTFFKAATLVDIEIAAYPFTTIKPNHGVGFVRVECVDKEFNVQCNPRQGYCKDGIRYVPVKIIDVAGLVPGAHEGKGLGNQFLNDLNMADVLIHIVDISGSANEKGEISKPGSYDPANDVRFLENELDMWYFGILKKGWDKFARKLKQNKEIEIEEQLSKQMDVFNIKPEMIKDTLNGLNIDKSDPTKWTEDQLKQIAISLRKKTKPILIACNKIDIPGASENYERLKKEFPNYYFTPCSAESELALREAAKKGWIEYNPGDSDFKIINKEAMNEKQLKALEFIRENVLKKYGSTGVQSTLDASVFDFLKYIAVFPGGVNKLADKEGRILPDVFLMPPGSTVLDFARKIHTDLAKGFLYAIDVRTKMKVKGDYKLKHRDIIEIVSTAK